MRRDVAQVRRGRPRPRSAPTILIFENFLVRHESFAYLARRLRIFHALQSVVVFIEVPYGRT